MTRRACRSRAGKWPIRGLVVVGALGVSLLAGRTAAAQGVSAANQGALKFTGTLDVPSVYVLRGIVQESDPKLTLQPAVDVTGRVKSGDGAFKTIDVSLGVWNSLQTGSSGSDGPTDRLHYEEDFYTMLKLGLGGGFGVSAEYVAFTSPNLMKDTVQEFQIGVNRKGTFNPYALFAFELTDKSLDQGERKGTYGEFGLAPSWQVGKRLTVTVPAKIGLSLKDYYELNGVDHAFGFFDVGGLATIPLGLPASTGRWNLHGGVDVIAMGDKGKAANDGNGSKVVATIGMSVSY